MKKIGKRKILLIIFSVLLCGALITIAIISNFKMSNNAESLVSLDNYDENDPTYDKETAIYVNFDGDNATCDNSNVQINKNNIRIIGEGVYVLSGKYNGNVEIETDKKVRLILNNVNITPKDGSAIYVINSDKTYITLEENTQNTLEDTTTYSNEEATATLFSKDDIVFNGNGTLNVSGNYQDGIVSKDDLKIVSGIINVTAMNNSIKGKDSVKIIDGQITVKAGNDGIKSTNSEEEDKGYIEIKGGNIVIDAEHDAIQAEKDLTIEDGIFNITSGGGSVNSTKVGKSSDNLFMGGRFIPNEEIKNSDEDTESYKGIKSNSSITITGGTFNINSADDSLHSNANINISGATFEMNSGDDGIHADNNLIINSGTIKVNESYEGIEANNIEINGGDINITASDDGVNVAGGNDSSSIMGRTGQNNFSSSTDNKLTINDGKIYVNSKGDGLDSNGSIYINGGEIYVDGPEDDGNGALDYERECIMNGGTLIAVGSSGMAQAISNTSSVYCLNANLSSRQNSGTKISITNSSDTIIEYVPSKSYNSVVIASSNLIKDTTYDLNIENNKYSSFTISSIITNLGNSMNGPMNKMPRNRGM